MGVSCTASSTRVTASSRDARERACTAAATSWSRAASSSPATSRCRAASLATAGPRSASIRPIRPCSARRTGSGISSYAASRSSACRNPRRPCPEAKSGQALTSAATSSVRPRPRFPSSWWSSPRPATASSLAMVNGPVPRG